MRLVRFFVHLRAVDFGFNSNRTIRLNISYMLTTGLIVESKQLKQHRHRHNHRHAVQIDLTDFVGVRMSSKTKIHIIEYYSTLNLYGKH